MYKKFKFYDQNTKKTWWFDIISGIEHIPEVELDYLVDDLIEDGEYLESQYGVHDIGFNREDLLGFTSYEIKEEDYPKVMSEWRDIFYARGITTSSIYHD